MKKFTLIFLMIGLATCQLSAQKFYLNVGIGGTLEAGTDQNFMFTNTTVGSTSTTYEIVPFSLGNGFYGNARFGIMVGQYLGFELGLGQFVGLSQKLTSTTELAGGTDYTDRFYGMMFSVIPAVYITPGLEKVNPYARVGLMIGAYPLMYQKSEETRATSTNYEIISKEKYSGSVALGINFSAGVEFNFSDMVGIFVELNYSGIKYAPAKSEIIEYTIDGVDHLGDLTVHEKETKYVKELTTDGSGGGTDPNSPDETLRMNVPFSGIGANFGVKLRFGK